MHAHPPRDHPASRTWSWHSLVIELAPVVLVAAALTAKMVYFSVAADPGVLWYRAPSWIKRALLASSGTFGTLLVALSPLQLLTRRRRLGILWIAALLLTLVVYADVLYVRYFGDMLSVAALSAARQLGMIKSSILALVKPVDILFFADLIVLPVVFRGRAADATEGARGSGRRAGLALLAAGAALSVFPVATILRRGEYDYFKPPRRGEGRAPQLPRLRCGAEPPDRPAARQPGGAGPRQGASRAA